MHRPLIVYEGRRRLPVDSRTIKWRLDINQMGYYDTD